MSRPRRDYAADEAEMRTAWLLVSGLRRDVSVRDIVDATSLPRRLALRVFLIRDGGFESSWGLWITARAVTVRMLERAILDFAYDERAQLEALSASSGQARAILRGATRPAGARRDE